MKIVLLLGTDGADVRSEKICRSLVRLGHEAHFVGWDRRGGENKNMVPGAHYHLMDCRVAQGRSTLWAQAKFTWYAASQLKAIKADVVCAVNEDNFLRAVFFRKRYFSHLVCDFYDSHADRFSESPGVIRLPIRAISHWCKKVSDRLVVTDPLRWERLGDFRHKASVIQNVPVDPGGHLASKLPVGETKILVTGAMSKHRGLEQILRAVEQCSDAKILAAGRPSDSFAERVFLQHPLVEYHGIVTPQESLELAAECDAIYAFYAPINQNQIYASPNKLFDAMCVGRPVILNSEVKMSQWAADQSVGLLGPYADIDALQAIIRSLPARRASLQQFAEDARRRYVESHSWQKMEGILAGLYESLEANARGSESSTPRRSAA